MKIESLAICTYRPVPHGTLVSEASSRRSPDTSPVQPGACAVAGLEDVLRAPGSQTAPVVSLGPQQVQELLL